MDDVVHGPHPDVKPRPRRGLSSMLVGMVSALLARDLAIAALDLLLPASCAGCTIGDGSAGLSGGLCPACRSAVVNAVPLAWHVEGHADGVRLPAFAAAAYDGVVRSMLLEFKEHGRLGLRPVLASCLTVGVIGALNAAIERPPPRSRAPSRPVLLVPVPSGAATRRTRGHDPVGALARIAASGLRARGVAVEVCASLGQVRKVADQSGLDVVGRQTNVAGAMEVRKPAVVRSRQVVVVDDIVTTGATALEAARALASAGSAVIGVAAVAATVRRYPVAGARIAPSPVARPVLRLRGAIESD